MGFVLWYLMRMEPFTSLHIWLQDGKFDKPDRLFESVQKTWKSCSSNPADVKELVPEWYTTPEMFLNVNKFDFGSTQAGSKIDDIELPPWAKNAYDFVAKNREALESEYVSQNLHKWIDLIWGYKQRPPHAVDACNVFFHLTYSGAVDLKALKETDPQLYQKTTDQIDNFGQIPKQLFLKPHPCRQSLEEVNVDIWPIASTPVSILGCHTTLKGQITPAGYLSASYQMKKPKAIYSLGGYQVSNRPLIFVTCAWAMEKIITVDATQLLGLHGWQALKPHSRPLSYMFDLDEPSSRLLADTSLSLVAESSERTNPSNSTSILWPFASKLNKLRKVGVPFAYQKLATTYAASVSTRSMFGNGASVVESAASYERRENLRAK